MGVGSSSSSAFVKKKKKSKLKNFPRCEECGEVLAICGVRVTVDELHPAEGEQGERILFFCSSSCLVRGMRHAYGWG